MKTEFIELSDTRRKLIVEIPSAVVDTEVERLARSYSSGGTHSRIPSRQSPTQAGETAFSRSDLA